MSTLLVDLTADYQITLKTLEKLALEATMQRAKYNQSKAAKLLGLSRGTLRYKLREHFGQKYFRDDE